MNIIDNTIKTAKTRQNVRLILSVLIHWAKSGQKEHTYNDLIKAIGKVRFSGISQALGAVHDVMDALQKETGKEIPTLNTLVKNGTLQLPSNGFSYVFPNYEKLNEAERRVFVAGMDSKAVDYPHWNWVLDQLGLKEFSPLTEEQLEAIKHPQRGFGGGEGEEHKSLKEYICQHPDCLGYHHVTAAETEHALPSGDKLDVYLELADGTHVAIEVKPSTSPEHDLTRGLFQCVKYRAVMDALRTIECADYEIKTLLVTACRLPEAVLALAQELNVDYKEEIETT